MLNSLAAKLRHKSLCVNSIAASRFGPKPPHFFKKVLTNQKSFVFLQHGKLLWFRALTFSKPPKWLKVFKETDGGNPYKECATFSIEVSFLLYPQFYAVLRFLLPNDRPTDINLFLDARL